MTFPDRSGYDRVTLVRDDTDSEWAVLPLALKSSAWGEAREWCEFVPLTALETVEREARDRAIRDVVEALRDVGGKSWTSRLPEAADFIEQRFGSQSHPEGGPKGSSPEASPGHAESLRWGRSEAKIVEQTLAPSPETPEVEEKYRGLAGRLGDEQRCDLCGGPVRAVTADEGTSYFVPLGADRALREALTVLREIAAWEWDESQVKVDDPACDLPAIARAALVAIEAQREEMGRRRVNAPAPAQEIEAPMHSERIAFGDSRLPERFWAKAEVQASGCWQWTGALNGHGYGTFGSPKGESRNAHRYAYKVLVADPGELVIDHLCRNRGCVNPSHLEPVTSAALAPVRPEEKE